MKRDMDIIRLLLLQLEFDERPKELKKYSMEEINYNSLLMIEAKLAEGGIFSRKSLRELGVKIAGNPAGEKVVVLFRMTWAGHDFLDAARNQTVWRTAKDKVLKSGMSWTFDLLKEALKALAKQQLARVGLPHFNA